MIVIIEYESLLFQSKNYIKNKGSWKVGGDVLVQLWETWAELYLIKPGFTDLPVVQSEVQKQKQLCLGTAL